MIKLLKYLTRWQLSTPILIPIMLLFKDNVILGTIRANLVGGLVFYKVDKLIFNKKE